MLTVRTEGAPCHPTISISAEHRIDTYRGAEWLSRQFTEIGLQNVEVLPTASHPIVYGDWLEAPRQGTILIYGTL
jgi:hypothetical protein